MAHSQGGYHCLFWTKVNWDKGGIGIFKLGIPKEKNRVVLKVALHDWLDIPPQNKSNR